MNNTERAVSLLTLVSLLSLVYVFFGGSGGSLSDIGPGIDVIETWGIVPFILSLLSILVVAYFRKNISTVVKILNVIVALIVIAPSSLTVI